MTTEATLAVTSIDHVALTVSDLDVSERFYHDVLGLMTLFDVGHGRLMLNRRTGFTLGLMAHEDRSGQRFTHTATGLDHLGFPVDSRDELVAWEEKLRRLGVPYTPIRDMELGYHLNFRDPDNIALELNAPNETLLQARALLTSGDFTEAEVRAAAAQHFGPLAQYVTGDRGPEDLST